MSTILSHILDIIYKPKTVSTLHKTSLTSCLHVSPSLRVTVFHYFMNVKMNEHNP